MSGAMPLLLLLRCVSMRRGPTQLYVFALCTEVMRHILYDTAVCLTQISILRFYVSEINAQVVCVRARALHHHFSRRYQEARICLVINPSHASAPVLSSLKVECRPPVPKCYGFYIRESKQERIF